MTTSNNKLKFSPLLFVYTLDYLYLMYQPKGDEEALSYERACSKNASTFSWSAIDGHPPANFIRTDTTTSWKPHKRGYKKKRNITKYFSSNFEASRFKRFFDDFKLVPLDLGPREVLHGRKSALLNVANEASVLPRFELSFAQMLQTTELNLSHYNFVRPTQKSEGPTRNCISPKSKNICKCEPHAVITLQMA